MTSEPNLSAEKTTQPTAIGPDGAEVSGHDNQPKMPLTPKEMDRFECLACGYTYEPAKGDDRNDIAAGVAFQDLPLNWRCPVCSAPKKRFANVGPAGSPSGFKENYRYGLGGNTLTPGQKSIIIFGALGLGFLFFISLYGLR
jgi:rubredoxin